MKSSPLISRSNFALDTDARTGLCAFEPISSKQIWILKIRDRKLCTSICEIGRLNGVRCRLETRC